MNMQIVISSQGSDSAMPLQLDVPGYRLEVSGIAEGRKLAVSEDSGRITVSIVTAGDVQPAAGEEEPPVEKAQPEVVPAVQQVVEPEGTGAVEPGAVPVPRQEDGVQPLPDSQPIAVEQELFQRLVALRRKISSEVRLPPYIIFHDSTLKDMCRLLPADLQAFGTIQGVGAAKLEKYGARFIEAIRDFTAAGKAA